MRTRGGHGVKQKRGARGKREIEDVRVTRQFVATSDRGARGDNRDTRHADGEETMGLKDGLLFGEGSCGNLYEGRDDNRYREMTK